MCCQGKSNAPLINQAVIPNGAVSSAASHPQPAARVPFGREVAVFLRPWRLKEQSGDSHRKTWSFLFYKCNVRWPALQGKSEGFMCALNPLSLSSDGEADPPAPRGSCSDKYYWQRKKIRYAMSELLCFCVPSAWAAVNQCRRTQRALWGTREMQLRKIRAVFILIWKVAVRKQFNSTGSER